MDKLDEFRSQIDEIDAEWIRLLAKRFSITAEIGKWKASHGAPPVDSEREQRQMEKLRKLAESEGLDIELTQKIQRLILDESVRNHKKIKGII
jgi:chorismate mutase